MKGEVYPMHITRPAANGTDGGKPTNGRTAPDRPNFLLEQYSRIPPSVDAIEGRDVVLVDSEYLPENERLFRNMLTRFGACHPKRTDYLVARGPYGREGVTYAVNLTNGV
jgi:hypothetical protein